ncbi:F-box only protein 33-like [Penaeus japonicus]|uniref:F-box only protein 33-like n=1 Tax=Penaeus japonicus TaxID=27405 RepID=UPI001C7111A8|nr:F-box only protein 33-like [Penaeus japonicus]
MSTQTQWHWNLLPSVILIEILSYLPLSDKISACSTCKAWRSALFHPSFWRKIELVFKSSDWSRLERSRFVASWGARKLRSCILQLETVNTSCLVEADHVLLKLTRNPQVEELILLPTHCHTFVKGHDRPYYFRHNNNNYNKNNTSHSRCLPCSRSSYQFIESAQESLQSIITNSRSLRGLSLGCIQDLTDQADIFLPLLARHQSSSLNTLCLASVKYDPDSYALLDITPDNFTSFTNLQVLTLDYDYMSDRLLSVLSTPYNAPLRRLVLHVHGIDQTHRGTTEYMWYRFKQQHPQCSLVMNLMHSYDGVEQLGSGLLHPSMPLTHFRAFFCEWINVAALRLMTMWYSETLRHLTIVDALDHSGWGMLTEGRDDDQETPDPLVMLAWKCKNLEHLTLCGYGYGGSDVVAIARLRGAGLKELRIPEDCLEADESHELADEEDIENIAEDVSAGLSRTWRPLTLSDLHPCVRTTSKISDTDQYMLSIVLSDSVIS